MSLISRFLNVNASNVFLVCQMHFFSHNFLFCLFFLCFYRTRLMVMWSVVYGGDVLAMSKQIPMCVFLYVQMAINVSYLILSYLCLQSGDA